ncbi:P-loop containing nucleoside triphosphate hydrolase protein [Dissoconium aciculare CBS 342.82]|uniref:P-loop containing nucleoside triphosphate hydrolase protein n=1 Tax=Dissoconium aciculare CBS 342.82 TaxID=1314786 RepID=A0A6J3LRI8_9PEZI|nr:P-loop containing nucleoside triphosphate hydrolase protein [Dissoconium aciculare CBS 342.82]KAF1817894.1 P-loop containing nucleoside triphosphate hydrolase protein [Dissoconium aciculare CBS 342.82]
MNSFYVERDYRFRIDADMMLGLEERNCRHDAISGAGPCGAGHLTTNVAKWKHQLDPLKSKTIPHIPEARGSSKEHNAGPFSIIIFHWLSPLLSIGYQRPLELNDIWMVNPDRGVEDFAQRFRQTLFARQKDSGRWNAVTVALFEVFKKDFIVSGFLQLTAACLQILSPFVLRYLLIFIQDAYVAKLNGSQAPPIGRGIGFVLGLTGMQIVQSLCTNHFFYRATMMGGQAKSAVTVCIFNKAMNLSGRAKAGRNDKENWSDGRITNLISTDVSRIESGSQMIHWCWTAPVQILLALALLCVNIGYSALAGFAFLVILTPLLGRAMKTLMAARHEINTLTDRRVRITQEMITGVRHIKIFGWEASFLDRLATARALEVKKIFHVLTIQNMLLAVALVTPVFAAILTFITYNYSGHGFDTARIFSSLALLNALTTPLEYLPLAVTQVINANASLKRISDFFEAEEYKAISPSPINSDASAITVGQAGFTWDSNDAQTRRDPDAKRKDKLGAGEKGGEVSKTPVEDEQATSTIQENTPSKIPFELQNIEFSVRRRELVMVVGAVGAGKSSLLSGLIGEMRQTQGNVSLGGSSAFAPQSAWIQDASVKENILFGESFESAWYDAVVDACALRDDFAILMAGDNTVVGEKGITLSGGQKQRINIARAVYSRRDIVLMDDPLSAVDAHIGRTIMDKAICGLLQHKCRILVTHQLQFLNRADRIIWMVAGRIHRMGSFEELLADDTGFQEMMANELKNNENQLHPEGSVEKQLDEAQEKPAPQPAVEVPASKAREEDRAVGRLRSEVYLDLLRATGSLWNLPIVLIVVASFQGSSIITSLWLSWWTSQRFTLTTEAYIGSCLAFCFAIAFSFYGTEASRTMLQKAVARVMKAPVRFFDTTPVDVDTLDNTLPNNLRMLCWLSAYYRASAREIQRHGAVLRTITGVITIRAYGASPRFERRVSAALDSMNALQRWLSLRLDVVGIFLVFVVGILLVTSRFDVSPSIGGVVFSYLSVRQTVNVENNMNSAERLHQYSKNLEQEISSPSNPMPNSWPEQGEIKFNNVRMRYRPGLPLVLEDLSIHIKAGERVGIVGRTGAGKSSIAAAILRLTETCGGSIMIDDVDIRSIGLDTLRSRLAMIPQDPMLFQGTIRSNLDPFGNYPDSELWTALHRARWVVTAEAEDEKRVDLDVTVDDEGKNFSLGQRQLLAFARVLVKDSNIVIFDEATSSIDVETDRAIQLNMLAVLSGKTVICIAHRLDTILGYDRILVMDLGRVAEFDTPGALFDRRGKFFNLCERSGISRDQLSGARRAADKH